MRACSTPGCSALVKRGYCEQHKRSVAHAYDAQRPSAWHRGYNTQWHYVRRSVLLDEPLCRFCKEKGHTTAPTEVDHIDGNVFNNERTNLRPLCKPCHSTRTARDQAFKPGPFYRKKVQA